MSTAETVTGQSGPGEQRPRTPLTARGGGIGVLAERAALPVAWVALIVIYSFTSPGLFLTWANISNILGSQAVLFVLAIAALMPSLTGDFDLSLGGVMGLVAMVVGVLNTEHHVGIVPACLIGVAVAVAAGCLNGFFVVTCDTNALIVTLGMGSVFTGLIYLLSGSNTVTGIDQSLSAWTFTDKWLGVPIEFYYGLALMLLVWYVSTFTPL